MGIRKFLCLLLILISCGQEKKAVHRKTIKLKMNSGILGGGSLLLARRPVDGIFLSNGFIGSESQVFFPLGSWDLLVIGWTGPSLFTGTPYCAGLNSLISSSVDALDITVRQSSCSDPNLGPSEYLENQAIFQKLELVNCENIGNVTSAESSCDGTARGSGNSYRLVFHNQSFNPDNTTHNPPYVGLISDCLLASQTSGTVVTNWRIPVGSSSGVHLPLGIQSYKNSSCTGDFREFFFSSGLTSGQSQAKTFDNGNLTRVFVQHEKDSLSITPNSGNFPATTVGQTSDLTFTATNNGSTSLANLIFSSPGAPFILINNNCLSTLNPGQQCQFGVRFNPTAAQSYSSSFNVNGFTVNLTGTGGSASASFNVSPTSKTYGNVPIGGSADAIFTINNTTTNTINFSLNNQTGVWSYPSNNCGTVSGNTSCNFTVRIAPTASATYNTNVIITPSVGGPITVPLAATGVTNFTTVTKYPADLLFGNVGVGLNADIVVSLKNTGQVTAVGLSYSTLSAPFSYISNGCGSSISVGQQCDFTVRYAPSASSTSSAVINVPLSNGNDLAFNVSGFGIVPSTTLTVNTANANFGSVGVGTNTNITFTVTNTGGVEASSLLVNGVGAPFSFLSNNCPSSLAAGGNCTFAVQFTPIAGQVYKSFVLVTSANASSKTIILNGTGVLTTTLALNPPNPNFGTIPVGGNADVNITLSNTGAHLASNLSIGSVGAPWSILNSTCGVSLTAGSNCTFTLRANPTGAGNINVTVPIASSTATNINLTANATGFYPVCTGISVSSIVEFWVMAEKLKVDGIGDNTVVDNWTPCYGDQMSATGTSRPTLFHLGAPNNNSRMKFDGIDDHMIIPNNLVNFNSGVTMIAVVQLDAQVPNARFLDFELSSDGFTFSQGSGTGTTSIQMGSNGVISNSAPLTIASWAILTHYADPDTSPRQKIYHNGTLANSTTGGTFTTPPNDLYIGANKYGSGVNLFLNASIAEMVVFNNGLTDAQRIAVECYLKDKYGLTLSYTCP